MCDHTLQLHGLFMQNEQPPRRGAPLLLKFLEKG